MPGGKELPVGRISWCEESSGEKDFPMGKISLW